MGLLAPLYALAALAIAGPILFHLIRRQPQGQLPFSSLMFLTPSPPRLTRRSRLDNLLLLLLRALAIGLIAFAFARPYFRREGFSNANLLGRNILILLDTSASMRRPEVWAKAQSKLTELLDSLADNDRVGLYTVDNALHAIVSLDNSSGSDATSSQQTVRSAAKQLSAGWRKSELAAGLRSSADLLNAAAIAGKIDAGADNEIVLISDLHTDCGLESLQGFPWPDAIRLDVRPILTDKPGNARPSLMAAEDDVENGSYRVRIENNADSAEQSLELVWADASGPMAGALTSVQVPAGQVRVIPMVARPPGADRLTLLGDAWDADNQVYVAEIISKTQRVGLVVQASAKQEDDLGYFLKQAPLSTEFVRREVVPIVAAELNTALADPELRTIVVEPSQVSVEQASALRDFAQGGGTVIVCLARENADTLQQAEFLDALFSQSGHSVREAEKRDFALLSSVDYRHPVFLPFADPRFNDFSKIRFWSHRVVELPQNSSSKVIASFDDQSPMLIQQNLDKGNIWLMTAGWNPTGSGLALSSKFVPILMGLLDPTGTTRSLQMTYEIGEAIPIDGLEQVTVLDATGQPLMESAFEIATSKLRIFEPGLFQIKSDLSTRSVAIQVSANESHLVPLDSDVFEQYGITLGKVASTSDRHKAARQLQIDELEQRQRLWQWLIAAGLVVLATETFLAGWIARKSTQSLAAT